MAIGAIGPAIGEAMALSRALSSIAQQPDERSTIVKTLFVGMAMVESTAIYCFVLAMFTLGNHKRTWHSSDCEKY